MAARLPGEKGGAFIRAKLGAKGLNDTSKLFS